MDEPKTSLEAPLLNPQPSQQENKRTYLKTGLIDGYFLFWVSKLIKVISIPIM